MNQAVPDCLVTGFEELIPGLSLPDPGDRHVLAAAIHGGAELLVTYNLADSPQSVLAAYDIQAQHPDEFIAHFLDAEPATVCAAAKKQRDGLRNPPKTVEEYLVTLASLSLPQTVAGLQRYADLL